LGSAGVAYVDDISVTRVGAVAEYDGAGATGTTWYDKSGNNLDGTVSGATLENKIESLEFTGNISGSSTSTGSFGMIGVGVANPAAKLEVEQNDVGIALLVDQNTDAVGLDIVSSATSANKFALRVYGKYSTQLLEGAADGKGLEVYSNFASNTYPLVNFHDDNATATRTTLKVRQDGTGDILNLFSGASTEVFTVSSSGNVGIGVTDPQQTLDVNGDTKFGDSSSHTHEFTGSVDISGSINTTDSITAITGSINHIISDELRLSSASLSYQENVDVDLAAPEVVATVETGSHDGVFFDYIVKNGTNVRAGIVMAAHNGVSVTYTDMSTTDLGNTTPMVLSVDLDSGNMRLMAIPTTDNWTVKAITRSL